MREKRTVQDTRLIDAVISVSSREVMVGGSNVQEMVNMGDRITIFAGSEAIILDATFPLQAVVKYKVLSGTVSNLNNGDKVYNIIKEKNNVMKPE